ncbi:phospho-sugar mutase [Arthrobacter roseus]|uniref:phospho-sugar mutase n=1 Tax=Arthrobacter roseus TaxID=136274 RepID=UPI001965570D|nr:phospho-sugar mutase [Arthrobacter roseus]MBM7848056.1 phosphomannomutase [Arthrobacter roseus]
MSSSASHDSAILAAAQQWAEADPDPATQQELLDLLVQVSDAGPASAVALLDIEDRFSGTLEFGTAGLRAPLGAGPMRMNRVVVRHTASGVARFLTDAVREGGPPRAVIGFDARHNSDVFALDTAAVFAAAGITTFLLPSALPTPVLAYAVRALDCDGGVMVTASHNPPQDNGYKVYLGGRAVEESGRGSQIVSPYDARIAVCIQDARDGGSIELADDGWTVLPDVIVTDYVASVTALARPALYPERDLKIVLTPLHGVGGATAIQVLESAGFDDVLLVAEQADPDPDFPTVDFPNPEEPGALDLALKAAADVGADIVLANDPDADRAAVAALDTATATWRMLRGDEVGALLGAHMVARLGNEPGSAVPVFANSIVSSRLLASIAAEAGYAHVETLTGFKWISRVPHLSYGYEEALGYCVAPDLVKDKDGISAALLIAELAAHTHAAGRTLFDLLDDLALSHGLHLSDQLSVRVEDVDLLGTMMDRLRNEPPSSFAGSPVENVVDLVAGTAQLPPTDGMLYLTQNRTRVIVRPSGTEPKLKCYLEVIENTADGDVGAARSRARNTMDTALADVRAALGLTNPAQ